MLNHELNVTGINFADLQRKHFNFYRPIKHAAHEKTYFELAKGEIRQVQQTSKVHPHAYCVFLIKHAFGLANCKTYVSNVR